MTNLPGIDIYCPFCNIVHYGGHVTDLQRHGRAGVTADVLSFVPLKPRVDGHRVFVPRYHVERTDTDFPLYAGLVAEYAAAHGAALGCDFNLILNSGPDATQTIAHIHWHAVPRRKDDGLMLPWTDQEGTQA